MENSSDIHLHVINTRYSEMKVTQSCLTLQPQLYSPCNSLGQNIGVDSLFLLQGIKPSSPALQVDSLPAEPQGKPKDTGVGSLSLLQLIFLTQESNQGLLHCRWILYQLSYQGSPVINTKFVQIPSHKKQNLTKQTNVIVCDPLENWKRAFFQVWDNWDIAYFQD